MMVDCDHCSSLAVFVRFVLVVMFALIRLRLMTCFGSRTAMYVGVL